MVDDTTHADRPDRPDRPDRLAAAASALAAAEQASGRDRTSPAPGAPDGAPRRRRTPPPPEDPATQDADADPESVARRIVLRQLTMGPRSRHQLEEKLRSRGCDEDVAARVLDRMTQVGLVDDAEFAQSLVRTRTAGKGLAKRALVRELRDKGIGDEEIDAAVGSVDAESERARAEELVARRLRQLGGLDPQVQARRLSGMLARKGYPPSVVYAVIRDAVNGAPEHRRD